MLRTVYKSGISLSLLAFLASTAMAAAPVNIVYYDEDFTDNALGDDIGAATAEPAGGNANFASLGLRTQQAWRPGGTYYGPTTATAFDSAQGFGAAMPFIAGFDAGAGAPTMTVPGRVWVFDVSMISDLAGTSTNVNLARVPSVIAEWNFQDPAVIGGAFAKGGIAAVQASVDDGIWVDAYSPLGDGVNPPSPIASSLTDANLPTQLNSVLRGKYVFQPLGTLGSTSVDTRASAQALSGNTVIGSVGLDVGQPGSFRDNYTGGMFVQLTNNHGSGNVTYSAGRTAAGGVAGDGVDEAYVNTTTDLELGVTRLSFRQLASADSTTDGAVDLNDGSILVANWNPGGSGRNFFQGDATGDGEVDLDDGSALVSQWTAAPDNAAAGTATATYNPANGHVLLDANSIALWRIDRTQGDDPAFFGPPNDLGGGRWTVSGTTKQNDANTIGELALSNSIHFDAVNSGPPNFTWNYAGVTGDLGQLFAAGLTFEQMVGVTFSYNTLGGQQVTVPLYPVPEPTSLGIAGLGLLGLAGVGLRRRRRAA